MMLLMLDLPEPLFPIRRTFCFFTFRKEEAEGADCSAAALASSSDMAWQTLCAIPQPRE